MSFKIPLQAPLLFRFINHSRVQIFLLDFFFVSNSIMTVYDAQKDIYAISSSSTIFTAIKLYKLFLYFTFWKEF